MSLAIGEVIGDYEVIGRLGAGGMGDVFKVRHVISERVEALKLLLDSDIAGGEASERFAREIRVLAQMQHANIATLHTAFRSKNRLAMVMEYVEGCTLGTRLRPPGISMAEGLCYISQVLAGLGYAHKLGVVHRDVKPSNIIIKADNTVKLVDFGIAMSGHDMRMTMLGHVVGSLHTMSPEQIGGGEVDARSDIYSVGVTLYEVVTGRLPIDGATQFDIMTAHMNRIPVAPSDLNPRVPARLSRIVMKAMAKHPNDRYQNTDQLLAELTAVHVEFSDAMETMMTAVIPSIRPSSQGGEEHHTPGSRKSGLPESDSRLLRDHPAIVEEVSRELATYIGPIARIIVNRAAKDCTTVHDLFLVVSQEIDSARDREKFLATKRRFAS